MIKIKLWIQEFVSDWKEETPKIWKWVRNIAAGVTTTMIIISGIGSQMKKYWREILIVICAITIALFAILPSKKQPNTQVVNIEKVKQEAVDSVKNEENKAVIIKIDSVNKVYEGKIKPLNKEIETLKAKLERQIKERQIDTVSIPCDSIIKTAVTVIDSLDLEVSILNSINSNMELKIEAINLSREIDEKNLLASYLENDKLKKELNRQTNWWHRNDKWVLLGAGVILTLLLK